MNPQHKEILMLLWSHIVAFTFSKGLSNTCYITLDNNYAIEIKDNRVLIISNNSTKNCTIDTAKQLLTKLFS